MAAVSVVIASHDRFDMLMESIESVAQSRVGVFTQAEKSRVEVPHSVERYRVGEFSQVERSRIEVPN
eukprot:1757541-Rhodomonas_salina.2